MEDLVDMVWDNSFERADNYEFLDKVMYTAGAFGAGILASAFAMSVIAGNEVAQAVSIEEAKPEKGPKRSTKVWKQLKKWAEEEAKKLVYEIPVIIASNAVMPGAGGVISFATFQTISYIHLLKHMVRGWKPTNAQEGAVKKYAEKLIQIDRMVVLASGLIAVGTAWFAFRHPEVVMKIAEAIEHITVRAIDEISEVIDKLGEAFIEPIMDKISILALIGVPMG